MNLRTERRGGAGGAGHGVVSTWHRHGLLPGKDTRGLYIERERGHLRRGRFFGSCLSTELLVWCGVAGGGEGMKMHVRSRKWRRLRCGWVGVALCPC